MEKETSNTNSIHWTREVGRRAPNLITVLRLLAVPVFVILLVDPTPQSSIWATVIFIFASITDWLDGYLARLFHAESILGTLLDPLADKILVMAALIMLSSIKTEPFVPAWMVVLLLSREMVVTGLRSIASIKGTVVAASRWAKHKTAWTMVAIVFLLIREPYEVFGILVDFHFSGMVFLWIA
ncbi:MAG: CDP-diacylglycerol--glycerol-3-phosphate 3-phosphatidyltransferase, partial [Deltaproteobacteria bacterium]|nr:CDP-diacylglycerol--glycerol-3-phosphate 3-phosphatidyltransferase [Deltaproteobacteria bacterium]